MALHSAAYRPTARPFSSIKRQHKVAWHGRWWADSHWQIGSPWCGPWGVGGLAASASSWVGSAGVFEIASHTAAITDSRVQVGLVTCEWEGASRFAWHLIRHTLKSHKETISVWPGARPCSPALPCSSIPRWTNRPMRRGQPPKARPSSPCSSCFPFAHSSPHPRGD